MGVDLRLHPLSYWQGKPGSRCFLGNALELDRRRELWAVFDELRGLAKPVGAPCSAYQDDGLREVSSDPYGSPLTWMRAGDFATVRERAEKQGVDETAWNAAVFAFLAALPPETAVVLWWH